MKLSQEHKREIARRRRVILNYDGMAGGMPYIEGEDLVQSMFGTADLPDSSIDSIFWCWGTGHWAMFKSKVIETLFHARFPRWIAEGFDMIGRCHEETKKRGLESFYSYRINGSDGEYWNEVSKRNEQKMPKFKKEHPECLIYDTTPGDQSPPLNFINQKVHDFKFNILEEVFERYDFDGIEIDFARKTPVLTPGHQWEERAHLTRFMSGIRGLMQERAAKRKHPILIAVRIPETIVGCHFDGIDVEDWVDKELVDILILGVRSFEVDHHGFLDLVRDKDVKCYPCIDDIHASDGYRNPPLETFRGIFKNWKHQGFEGIQTFNFQNSDVHVEGIRKETDKWLSSQWTVHKRVYEELRQREDGKYRYEDRDVDRTYIIQRRFGGGHIRCDSYPSDWYTPRRFYMNTNMLAQLPAKLTDNPLQDTLLYIYVGEDPSQVHPRTLGIALSNPENITVRLNNIIQEIESQENAVYYYAIGVDQLAEGVNLIGISRKSVYGSDGAYDKTETWVEKVEIAL